MSQQHCEMSLQNGEGCHQSDKQMYKQFKSRGPSGLFTDLLPHPITTSSVPLFVVNE